MYLFMGKKNNDFTISRMFCCNCGKEGVPIGRKAGHYREAGHLKKLYCLNCQQEWNFVEIRPFGDYDYNDFLTEFNYGNFDEEGQRKIPYRQFFAELREKLEKEE